MWGIRPQYASLLFPGPGTENVPWLDEEGAVRVSLLDIRYDRPSPKDRTPEEYDAYLENEVQRLIGMSPDEFLKAYEGGQLDEADPAVSEISMLLRVGRNGHSGSS